MSDCAICRYAIEESARRAEIVTEYEQRTRAVHLTCKIAYNAGRSIGRARGLEEGAEIAESLRIRGGQWKWCLHVNDYLKKAARAMRQATEVVL